jgi:mycofactocin precursor
MSKAITAPADEQTPSTPSDDQSAHALIEADMLIEEISIDGMCGVY